MTLKILGIDFTTAPLEVRAKAAPREEKFLEVLALDWPEKALLATCNRAEFIGIGDESLDAVLNRWKDMANLEGADLPLFKKYTDQDALAHLFRVVSGMESMVVGETQIAGQVKKAYELAVKSGFAGPSLHKVFQCAFKAAKKIRAQTEVGRLQVSVPSIAVKLAEKVLGSLSSKSVAVLGLGDIGRVAAEYFGSVQPKHLYLYNRTRSVAVELSDKLQKEGIQSEIYDDLDSLILRADVIVSAASAMILDSEKIKAVDSRGLPIFVIDLSVPPSIEKIDVKDIFLYNIDDLKKISEENSALREQEVEKAEMIVQSEVRQCWSALQVANVSQTFDQLKKKVDTLKEAELVSLKSKLGGVSPEAWQEIEKMAARLSHKILQDPMIELRNQIEAGSSESLLRFFRDIFRI